MNMPVARIPPPAGAPVSIDDPVVDEARRRWNLCAEWESSFRTRFLDDIKFANGDSDNGYQWPNAIRTARNVDGRPCLTMNVIRQHNFQISNESRRNKQTIKVEGQGNGATRESADVMTAIIRRIEQQSQAQNAYTIARGFQIDGGIGWWRLATKYAGEDTFDQDIEILPVIDPLSIYLDPDIQQKSGSDARFGFVFDLVPKDQWNEAYPKFADLGDISPLGISSMDGDWSLKDHVRVCEYFRKVAKRDKLVSFVHLGERKFVKKSMLTAEMFDSLKSDSLTRVRDILDEVIEWKLIVAEKVVDETVWPGKYIPLIRIIGEENQIEGVLDRKGHTRAMKDSQRMYNYNASAQVEFVALQGKTPWVGPVKAIEEVESMWNTANLVNHSYLPYNHLDDEGNPIPPPQRTEPPNAAPGFETGMQTAFNQMMMTSGQWQNQMGMGGNERTGAAIGKRQDQGDTATYHFQDNYEIGLLFTGRQLIDLIPKIYDTKRVLMIQADDGMDFELEIDPAAQQVWQAELDHQGRVVQGIFNPQVGKYDVAEAIGPAYGSRREQTVDALTLLITQAPQLTGIIGDVLVKHLDFEGASEAAMRLKRLVPPEALGTGPSAKETQLMTQVQALTMALEKSLQVQGKTSLQLKGKNQMRDIDVYKAETERINALKDLLPMDQPGLSKLIEETIQESLGDSLQPILDANEDDLDTSSGLPKGARVAPDGEAYLEHPAQPGKYLKLERPRAPVEIEHAIARAGGTPDHIKAARKAPDGNWYVPDQQKPGGWMRVET